MGTREQASCDPILLMNENNFGNMMVSAAESTPVERSQFIRRTYAHLAGAILAFIVVEALLLTAPFTPSLMQLMIGSQYSWLIVMGLFMGVSWLAQSWAQSGVSKGMQYMGLGLYVVAQAVVFVPLIWMAKMYSTPDVIPMAAIMTLGLFLGLTGVVVVSRVDFSFLGSVLTIGFFIAMGVIVASIIFGFNLGIVFSGAMVLFASIAILYNTSAVLRDYPTDQYVAASLTLFASVVLLFWYILRIFMSRR